jgi:uncharacterized protein YajQ (UPF0234 family)
MAGTSSFDVTTGVDFMEVNNAVDQATKEITQRYDFKGLKVTVELNAKEKTITLSAPDDYKLKAIWDVLQTKMVRRQVPLKNLKPGTVLPAAGASVRQQIEIQDGLTADMARLLGEQGRPAGRDRAAQAARVRRRAQVRQLPQQLRRRLRPGSPLRRGAPPAPP